MKPLRHIGKPANRVDGPEKVRGSARYTADMHVPGQLVARVLRSSIPHGRIVRLDVTPALAVPGVLAAITAADFANHGRYGFPIQDNFVLAHERVRYVGDAIAAVAAETAAAAEAGLAAIVLELEPLPVVDTIEAALAANAPLVAAEERAGHAHGVQGEGNLCLTQVVRNGDPAPLLAASAVQLDAVYHTAFQEHAYLEPEAVLAVPNAANPDRAPDIPEMPNDGLTVYACNQSPFVNRDTTAAVLGLSPEQVRIVQPYVGGSFGGKDEVVYEMSAQTARLAQLTGRPVGMVFGREESMLASYKRNAARIHIRLGADSDGTLQAAHIEAWLDGGAYSAGTALVSWRGAMHLAGAYRYKAVHADNHVVYTNNSYSSAFRGFGNTEATACIEQAIDELADQAGIDPIAFRLHNALNKGDTLMTGNPLQQASGMAACLQWVRDRSGWQRKRAAFAEQNRGARHCKGIGVACYFHGISMGSEGDDHATITLKIEHDNTIILTSGLTDYGPGSRTVYTLVAAELLQVPPEHIQMPRPDTEQSVNSGPTVASRASVLGGNATRVAAENLLAVLKQAAADWNTCAPEQILHTQGVFVGPAEEPLTLAQVADHARQMGLDLAVQGRWEMPPTNWNFTEGTGTPYAGYSFGAQIIEVTVNRGTGKIDIDGIWAAHDAGTILFPQGAYGQLYGGIAQGIGYGLMEEVEMNHGYIHNLNFDDYLIPTARDLPDIDATFIEVPFEPGPFGAKNVAEPAMIGAAPAIANAVAHATGRRVRELPLTPERLLLGRPLQHDDRGKRARMWLGIHNRAGAVQ